jgi:hypothetical protein
MHWYAENVVWKKILDWRPNPQWPLSPVPVHFLTSIHDWRMALWMLASLHKTTQRRWQITLHDDGSLHDCDLEHFRRIFPGIRILRTRDVEERMTGVLSNYPRCRDYRNLMPHGLKCFDIPEFCEASRYLMIDPDLLFFRPPLEILQWVENFSDSSCWFNKDFQDPSPLPPAQAMADFGVPLWPCVNTGLCLLQRGVVRDLDSMEKWLGHPALQNPKMQWRVEQTLLALCASQAGAGGLLPEEYEVSPHKNREPTGISRHYIGCVRDRFYSEGILELHKSLFN